MSVSKALLRLLRIRAMEEERRRLALETELRQLRALEKCKEGAVAKEKRGREFVANGAQSGDLADLTAGLAETQAGRKQAQALSLRIAASEAETLRLGQEFFEKRTERRQAETLIDQTLALEAAESERRRQKALDDWYRSRRFRELTASRQDEE